MRDILFRGKRLDNGERIEGYYVKYIYSGYGGYPISNEVYVEGERHFIIPPTTGTTSLCIMEEDARFYEVDPETVGEYTGLTDKNGVKIFEGDLIVFDGDIGHFQVKSCNGAFVAMRGEEFFRWGAFCKTDHTPYVPEIVGNIHDKPELLKEDL